nr:hypothetical protein [Tanacetum cinerariifolium]
MVDEDDEMSQDKEIDKLMALISLSFKKIYKPTNNNLRTSSNTSRANQDNSPRINRNAGYENQWIGIVAGARETVGSSVEYGHVARECQKPKRAKDAAYHREKMLLYYDEVFALVAMIEAIKIFLAFASYMGFIVYQMDVKSAFLYGKINEEVAWYATLSTFMVQSGYRRGLIDKTLFIKKDKKDIMLVQVYVDDIIFGSTKKSWCDEFEALMKNIFKMSFI